MFFARNDQKLVTKSQVQQRNGSALSDLSGLGRRKVARELRAQCLVVFRTEMGVPQAISPRFLARRGRSGPIFSAY